MRVASAVLAALLSIGQLAALVHRIAEPHRTCEHGEVTHASSGPAAVPGRIVPGEPEREHNHGCALLFFASAAAVADVIGAALPHAHDAALARLPARDVPSSHPLEVAPSRGPPLRAPFA
ncbi:MAG: hypothetical protein AABZ30_11045 [Myxococcota bacterium]